MVNYNLAVIYKTDKVVWVYQFLHLYFMCIAHTHNKKTSADFSKMKSMLIIILVERK